MLHALPYSLVCHGTDCIRHTQNDNKASAIRGASYWGYMSLVNRGIGSGRCGQFNEVTRALWWGGVGGTEKWGETCEGEVKGGTPLGTYDGHVECEMSECQRDEQYEVENTVGESEEWNIGLSCWQSWREMAGLVRGRRGEGGFGTQQEGGSDVEGWVIEGVVGWGVQEMAIVGEWGWCLFIGRVWGPTRRSGIDRWRRYIESKVADERQGKTGDLGRGISAPALEGR